MHPTALTQLAPRVHDSWHFGSDARQRWVLKIDWPELQPIPRDVSQETLDFLVVSTGHHADTILTTWEKCSYDYAMLSLRTLVETDWLARRFSSADLDELESARKDVICKLSPLGGLDDVRLFFALNY